MAHGSRLSVVAAGVLLSSVVACREERAPEGFGGGPIVEQPTGAPQGAPPAEPAPPAPPAPPARPEEPQQAPQAQTGGGETALAAKITITGVQLDSRLAEACGIGAPQAFFRYDSAAVREQAEPMLDALATCLTDGPLKGREVVLVGHTDPVGPDPYNQQLGKSRAQSVKEELDERGVKVGRLETKSVGEKKALEAFPSTWPADRRVDIRLAE